MRRPPRAVLGVAGLLVVLLVVAVVVRSCTGPEKTIEVYVDASLRHAFADLGEAFEEEHDVAVELTVDSAGGHVLTLMDSATMPDVLAAGDPYGLVQVNGLLAGEPLVLAEDHLVIAVPRGNPAEIEDVDDLAGQEVAVCHINEACGRLAHFALLSAGIEVRPVEGSESAATTAEVVEGEVDAGLVLASEADAAGDAVEVIELPWAGDRVSYPSISLLDGGPDPDEGQEFIDFVVGETGQEILADHGFAPAENPHLQPED
ncbi:molybdate ABC transporter substrate-binding protein [Nocardioides sediminis]|uniref:molybdate ABC transporter substrate-binding protein n=1 Tax=Nocardioides sediminis TaxID=433648 RepID=UPI000D2FA7E3|nr:substrate-binding domain-containing protein [Nocardioides sediminis]